jgi:hypothetical protein
VPLDAVKVEVSVEEPEIEGSALSAGGVAPVTTAVFAETSVAAPVEL